MRKYLLAPMAVLGLTLAACGGDDPEDSTGVSDGDSAVTTDASEADAGASEGVENGGDDGRDGVEGDVVGTTGAEAGTEAGDEASGDDVVLTFSTDYNDETQEAVMNELIAEFEAQNPGVSVEVDTVSYASLLEQLPLLLESGEAPDLMGITNLNLNPYFLDLSPYVDVEYWDENMGLSNSLLSAEEPRPSGIFLGVTVTGPFINRTLFEQAGVEVPSDTSDEVTWEEWAEASRQVRDATGIDFAMAMDRSGHRFTGPAISQGAQLFDADGNVVLPGDEGFRDMSQLMVDWHADGTMPLDVWAGGDSYRDGRPEFVNANLAFYMSGNWQIAGFAEEIQGAFEWEAVPPPCGPGGCTGMPGGTILVGYSETEHPAEVAAFIDFIAAEDNYRTWSENTLQVPQHDGLIAAGLDYTAAPEESVQSLTVFSESAANIDPIAADMLGYEFSTPYFNSVRDRLTQAILGELAIDDAIERMQSDLDTAIAGAG